MSGICLSLTLAVWDVRDLSVTHFGGLGCQRSVCHSFWRFGMLGICLSLIFAVWDVRDLSVTHSGGLGCQGSICH
jgi:lipid-A-disaccharide synthase-like uncharacterized protein